MSGKLNIHSNRTKKKIEFEFFPCRITKNDRMRTFWNKWSDQALTVRLVINVVENRPGAINQLESCYSFPTHNSLIIDEAFRVLANKKSCFPLSFNLTSNSVLALFSLELCAESSQMTLLMALYISSTLYNTKFPKTSYFAFFYLTVSP